MPSIRSHAWDWKEGLKHKTMIRVCFCGSVPMRGIWLRHVCSTDIQTCGSKYSLFLSSTNVSWEHEGTRRHEEKGKGEIQSRKELITWGAEGTITPASKIHWEQFLPFSVRCVARSEELILLGTASCQWTNLQVQTQILTHRTHNLWKETETIR